MSRLNSSPRQSRGGVCRYCRCTESNACVFPIADLCRVLPALRWRTVTNVSRGLLRKNGKRYFTCCWINKQQTVCSNPRCVRKHQLHLRAIKLQRRTRVRNGRQLGFNQRRQS